MSEVMNFSSTDAEELADTYRGSDAAAAGLQAAIKANKVRNELDADLRIFVAPLEPNSKFMVSPGQLERRTFNNDLGYRDISRDGGAGDVWAEFHSGICATRDPEVIKWCEAHSGDAEIHREYHAGSTVSMRDCGTDVGLCRDADWAATPAWADMKKLQQPTAQRAAYIPVSTDVDALFDRLAGAGTSAGAKVVSEATKATRQADKERN